MFKNTVNLIGFIGKNAEVKVASDSSTNFTILSLATKESWKNRDTSEWESRTEWHNIIAFGKLGEFAATLTKGAHIEVEGSLRSRERTIDTTEGPVTVRTFSIRAEWIRKLDGAEKAPSAEQQPTEEDREA